MPTSVIEPSGRHSRLRRTPPRARDDAAAASAVVRQSRGRCAVGDDRVGRQPVDLRLVEQQEERAEAADAVVRVVAVEPRRRSSRSRLELREPLVGALAQLVELAELDRVGRARLRARRLVAALQPVVAERALPDAPVLLLAEERQRERRVVGRARQVALVDDAERARRHAVAAAVADVLLHDDRAELGAEERRRSGRRRGSPRACSACRRPTPSASAAARARRRRRVGLAVELATACAAR